MLAAIGASLLLDRFRPLGFDIGAATTPRIVGCGPAAAGFTLIARF